MATREEWQTRLQQLKSAAQAGLEEHVDLEQEQASPESERRPRLRWQVMLTASITILVVLAVLAVLLWQMKLPNQVAEDPVAVVVPAGNSQERGTKQTDTEQSEAKTVSAVAELVIHVSGAVNKPGVVKLPTGSRVYQAIAAAGGATPEAAQGSLNLAQSLEDGQQVSVPTQEQVAADPGGSAGVPTSAASSSANGSVGGKSGGGNTKVNLNTAGATELRTLPRVGEKLAERILNWRQSQGKFRQVEDLRSVDGIGSKMFQNLAPLVTV